MKPSKDNEPDRRAGGTFIRDKDGTLLEHRPPTKAHEPAQAPVADDASAGADASTETPAAAPKAATTTPQKKRK